MATLIVNHVPIFISAFDRLFIAFFDDVAQNIGRAVVFWLCPFEEYRCTYDFIDSNFSDLK